MAVKNWDPPMAIDGEDGDPAAEALEELARLRRRRVFDGTDDDVRGAALVGGREVSDAAAEDKAAFPIGQHPASPPADKVLA